MDTNLLLMFFKFTLVMPHAHSQNYTGRRWTFLGSGGKHIWHCFIIIIIILVYSLIFALQTPNPNYV